MCLWGRYRTFLWSWKIPSIDRSIVGPSLWMSCKSYYMSTVRNWYLFFSVNIIPTIHLINQTRQLTVSQSFLEKGGRRKQILPDSKIKFIKSNNEEVEMTYEQLLKEVGVYPRILLRCYVDEVIRSFITYLFYSRSCAILCVLF